MTLAEVRHGELSGEVVACLTSSLRPLKELSELVLRAASQEELEQLLT